jgi:outer membrane protein insertion porin family
VRTAPDIEAVGCAGRAFLRTAVNRSTWTPKAFVLLAMAAILSWSPQATGDETDGARVLQVKVRGNQRLSDEAVLADIRTRPGQSYYDRVVREDRRRLLRSGRFRSVVATAEPEAEGVVVTFVVVERPVVAKVELRGNKKFSTNRLLKELTFSASDPLDVFTIEAGRRALLLKYRSANYHFARVTVSQEDLEDRDQVIYTIVEGPKVRIREIVYEGNRFFSNRSLKWTTQTSSRPWWWLLSDGLIDGEKIWRDVDAIREKYVEEGFLDAEVSRRLEFSPDKKDVRLTFVIHENQRYRIGRIVFRGNRVFSDAELARRLALKPGDFAQGLAIQRDVRQVRDTYGELGYVDARARLTRQYASPDAPLPDWARERADEKASLVNLVLDIEEGNQCLVGRVDIRSKSAYRYGDSLTQTRVVRREVTLRPGQLYNTKAATTSRQGLLDTQLFGKVTITPSGKAEGVRDALVEIEEGQTANIIVGVGVSTNSGLAGRLQFVQRNFDLQNPPGSWRDVLHGNAWKGAGQTFRASFEPGTDTTGFFVSLLEPAFRDLPYTVGASGYITQDYRDNYDEDREGGVLSLGHRFPNGWYAEVSSRTENVHLRNIEADAPSSVRKLDGASFIQGFRFVLDRNRADSRWIPTTGDHLTLRGEQVVGDFTFQEVSADYRIYQTLHVDALDRKHVLAMKFSAGQIINWAPPFERFYGGGVGSVRGFRFRGISPRQGLSRDAVGGDFTVFAGAEYGYPLIGEQLRGVVFFDTGAVDQDIEVGTYRMSTGFGLRWFIPAMGPVPIRLDFGFPIVKDSEDDTQLVSFSMGFTF